VLFSERTDIRFDYSTKEGLTVTCNGLDEPSIQLLADHVAETAAADTSSELQGRTLLLVLTSKPRLWDLGTLVRKN